MCPVCISTVALTVAGATSTGGLTALVVKKLLPKSGLNRPHRSPGQKESFPGDKYAGGSFASGRPRL